MTSQKPETNASRHDELTRLTRELHKIIVAEETEIELLSSATGTTAEIVRAVRGQMVDRLKMILR